MMKKQLFLLVLLMIVLPELIDAGVASPAAKYPGFIEKIVNAYTAEIAKWLNTFVQTAEYLFAIFVPIEMVLMFGPKMLKGDIDLGSIAAELVRLILIFGLMWYLMHATTQLYSIFQGFEQLGSDATGGMKLDKVFSMTLELFDKIWKNIVDTSWSWSGLGAMVILGVIAIILVIVLFSIIGIALKNEIFAILAVFISPIFFAMGAFHITRPWAQSGLLLIIRYSAKYMGAMLVLGLTFSTIEDAMATPFENNPEKMVLLFVVLITLELSKGIEGMIDGMFSGMHQGHGSVLGNAALGGAAATAFVGGKASANVAKGAAGVAGGTAGGAISGAINAASRAEAPGMGKVGNFMVKAGEGVRGLVKGGVAGGIAGGVKGLAGKSKGIGFNTGINAGRVAAAPGEAIKKEFSKLSEKISGGDNSSKATPSSAGNSKSKSGSKAESSNDTKSNTEGNFQSASDMISNIDNALSK